MLVAKRTTSTGSFLVAQARTIENVAHHLHQPDRSTKRFAVTVCRELIRHPIRLLQQRSMSTATYAVSPSKSVLVPIADGTEEIEAVTIVDTLRRAGAVVTVASVESSLQVEMSRKVKIVADTRITELTEATFDLIALPGGMPGAERLRNSAVLSTLLEKQSVSKRYYTAICAAPAVILEFQGLLRGKKATAHPAFSEKLSDQSLVSSRVVVDGNLITSRGPGTSLEFALTLVRLLFGKAKADEVAKPMMVHEGIEY